MSQLASNGVTWAMLPMWQRTADSLLAVVCPVFVCMIRSMNYANILCCRILGVIIVTIAAPFLLLYDLAKCVGAGLIICWIRLRRLDAASDKSPPFVSNDADIIVSVCPLKIVDDPTSQNLVGRVKTNEWLMVDGSLKYARGQWWAPLADGGWVATSAPMDPQVFDVTHKRKSPVPFLRHRTPEETFDLCVYDLPNPGKHLKRKTRPPSVRTPENQKQWEQRDGELHRRVRHAIRQGLYRCGASRTVYANLCMPTAFEQHGFDAPVCGDGPFHLLKDGDMWLKKYNRRMQPWFVPEDGTDLPDGKYFLADQTHCLSMKATHRGCVVKDGTKRDLIPRCYLKVPFAFYYVRRPCC